MQPAEAARRVRRYETTLDPRALWPDVTEDQFAAAMREIVRVTSLLLAPAPQPAEVASPVPGGPAAFGVAAFASGVGPLLGYWMEGGRLAAPAELADVLASHLDHGRRRAARLRAELERIVGVLGAEQIEVTVLKGMHTGWAYFPEPGTRPASDIDMLIDPGRAADARRLLEAAGLRRAYGIPERSTWAPPGNASPASVQLTHADNPWTLDLHVTLDRRFPSAAAAVRFGLRSDEDLEQWHTGAMRVRVLSQPLLSCFLAVHAIQHLPYVSALRLVELLLVIQRDGGTAFPWDRLAGRLEATGASAFAYPGLKLAADLLPGLVDQAVLARLRRATPPRVREFANRLTPATALQMFRHSFEGRFLWAGSGWRRLGILLQSIWPRDSAGGRAPVAEAVRVTRARVRRLAAGLLSWRHR